MNTICIYVTRYQKLYKWSCHSERGRKTMTFWWYLNWHWSSVVFSSSWIWLIIKCLQSLFVDHKLLLLSWRSMLCDSWCAVFWSSDAMMIRVRNAYRLEEKEIQQKKTCHEIDTWDINFTVIIWWRDWGWVRPSDSYWISVRGLQMVFCNLSTKLVKLQENFFSSADEATEYWGFLDINQRFGR